MKSPKQFLKELDKRRLLLVISCIYWVLSIVSFVINRHWLDYFATAERYQETCYRTDALLVSIECIGFSGAGITQLVLNLYWGQYQMMLIVLQGITELPRLGVSEIMFMLMAIIPAAVLWLPLAYPFWYLLVYLKKRRNNKSIIN